MLAREETRFAGCAGTMRKRKGCRAAGIPPSLRKNERGPIRESIDLPGYPYPCPHPRSGSRGRDILRPPGAAGIFGAGGGGGGRRRLGRCRHAGRLCPIALHPVECNRQRVPKGLSRQGIGPCRGRSRKHLHDDSRAIGLGDRRSACLGGRQHPGENRCLRVYGGRSVARRIATKMGFFFITAHVRPCVVFADPSGTSLVGKGERSCQPSLSSGRVRVDRA